MLYVTECMAKFQSQTGCWADPVAHLLLLKSSMAQGYRFLLQYDLLIQLSTAAVTNDDREKVLQILENNSPWKFLLDRK